MGDIGVTQIKNLSNSGFTYPEYSILIDHSSPKSHRLTKQKDIVFHYRHQTNPTALLQSNTKSTITAVRLFAVQPNTNNVVPGFVLWRWADKPPCFAFITKQSLANLGIHSPSVNQSKKITNFFNLSVRKLPFSKKANTLMGYLHKEF